MQWVFVTQPCEEGGPSEAGGPTSTVEPPVLAVQVQGGRWVAPFLDPATPLGTVLLIRGLSWTCTHDDAHRVWRAEATECAEVLCGLFALTLLLPGYRSGHEFLIDRWWWELWF